MQRTPSAKVRAEYDELAAYLRHYLLVRNGSIPESYDANAAEIIKRHGWGKALVGLRQAVNDTIEDLNGIEAEVVGLFDQSLKESGLVSFSALRQRYSSRYKNLLKRGVIRNDTDFYLASAVVSDLSLSIPSEQRERLQSMVEEYEREA